MFITHSAQHTERDITTDYVSILFKVFRITGSGIRQGSSEIFSHLSRPALGPIQPPVQWVWGLSRGVKSGRGVTLTPHPLLVPWS